jgi:alpha-L-rhamnosidase
MKIYCLFLIATLSALNAMAQGLGAVYLRCEYKENPVTDVTSPRLSWELTSQENGQLQSAYQILVASSAELLSESKADL